jgi:hypothetical protein
MLTQIFGKNNEALQIAKATSSASGINRLIHGAMFAAV